MARVGRLIPGVFVTGGNPDAVNDAAPTNTTVGSAYDLRGQYGAVLRSADGSREWIYAQFSSTSTGKAPAANQICYWVANSTSNLATPNAWVVDNQTSANTGTSIRDAAGILRNACTRGNGVWLLRKSGTTAIAVVSTNTACNPGDLVVCTTASGEAAVIGSTSTVIATGGIGTTPWYVGSYRIGYVFSTTTGFAFVGSTSTVSGVGVNLPTMLDME